MLPAYAGMIPEALMAWDAKASAPRVCGDDPTGSDRRAACQRCSPRMRG